MAPKRAKTEAKATEAAKEPKSSPSKTSALEKEAKVVPLSPVLHGLKFGCKRTVEDCALNPPSGGVGSLHKLRKQSSIDGFTTPLDRRRATLILDDGTRFSGYSFGAETSISGEVVFNTSMVGYPEALTDPSYRGQILTLTYPLVGNYGVPAETKDDLGLPIFYESDAIHITALICSEYSTESCHWNQSQTLGNWLAANNIPGISGIDTRELTKRLRERGAMLGKIVFEGEDEVKVKQVDPNMLNLVSQVSIKEPKLYVSHAPPLLSTKGKRMRILAVDCGMKGARHTHAPPPHRRHSAVPRPTAVDCRRAVS